MCTQFSSSGWSSLITIALSSKNLGSNFSRSSSFELSVSILYDTQLLHRCCCCAIEALSVSSQTWYLHNSERFETQHIKLCFVVLKAWVEKQYKLSNLVSLSAGLGQRRSINKQNGGLGYFIFGCPLTSFALRKLGLFEFIFLNNWLCFSQNVTYIQVVFLLTLYFRGNQGRLLEQF